MTPVNETTRTGQWIFETLAADNDLTALIGGDVTPRIHEDVAPQGSAYPLVVFQLLAPSDVAAHDAARLMTTDIWMVKGIDKAEEYSTNLTAIADRIEALLHRSAGGDAGDDGTVFTSVRVPGGVIHFPEIDEGTHYRHLGGQYRIYTQAASA